MDRPNVIGRIGFVTKAKPEPFVFLKIIGINKDPWGPEITSTLIDPPSFDCLFSKEDIVVTIMSSKGRKYSPFPFPLLPEDFDESKIDYYYMLFEEREWLIEEFIKLPKSKGDWAKNDILRISEEINRFQAYVTSQLES